MDSDTYTDKRIIDFAKNNLISIKIDSEKGTGPEQKTKYRVRGYPTILVLDSLGNEIDRIVGYRPPEEFLKELIRIKNGENTLSYLQEKFINDSGDISLQLNIAEKYIDLNLSDSAKKYLDLVQKYYLENNQLVFKNLFILSQFYNRTGFSEIAIDLLDQIIDLDIDSSETAYFYSLLYKAKQYNNINDLMEYVDLTDDTTRKKQSYWQIIRILKKNVDNQSLEAELYLKVVNLYDKKYKYLPRLLNSFSWRMTELGLLLPEALEKVNIALEFGEDLKILDTKAEVLWKLGRVDEALEVISKCIQGNPEYQYYQNQKEKFLNTKAI